MNTNDLKAGRELDCAIAEKIMGWTNLKHDLIIETGWDLYGARANGEGDFLVPDYSTDIAAAWLVMEKSRGIVIAPAMNGQWCCSYGLLEIEQGEFIDDAPEIFADTAPLAICLAALKAYSHKVP